MRKGHAGLELELQENAIIACRCGANVAGCSKAGRGTGHKGELEA